MFAGHNKPRARIFLKAQQQLHCYLQYQYLLHKATLQYGTLYTYRDLVYTAFNMHFCLPFVRYFQVSLVVLPSYLKAITLLYIKNKFYLYIFNTTQLFVWKRSHVCWSLRRVRKLFWSVSGKLSTFKMYWEVINIRIMSKYNVNHFDNSSRYYFEEI